MLTRYKSFSVTGSANATAWDDGIQATEVEAKHIVGLYINVSAYNGNIVKINIDREEIASIPDKILDSDDDTGSTNVQYGTNKEKFIPIDVKLKVGETLQIGITSGASATSLIGAYVYDEGR